MNDIEQKITLFLEQACDGKASFSEELVQEFGERCKDILRKGFLEKPEQEREFTLRMSNIGRSLRQLMLAKINKGKYKPNKEAKVKFTIGHIVEAFLLVLLKQSGCAVVDHDKQVMLPVGGTKLYGTYDVKIDDKIYDIKTASPYSFENKFCSVEALRANDSFGYFAQGFGYGLADGSNFGGWIAINKVTGEIKVLDIPKYEHDKLQEEYRKQIEHTITFINDKNSVIPDCCGVIDEYFNKAKTGNRILTGDCGWCDYKQQCHKELLHIPDVNSKAKEPKLKWYVGRIFKPKEK